ncbi:glycine cleavage system protein GcvH [bacterium]
MKYSKSHEWIREENGVFVVGITEHAAKELGDIVFVELPNVGDNIEIDKSFGIVESVKSVSDLISPLNAKIEEVNTDLETNPELINESPYEKGWIMKVSGVSENEINSLLNKDGYEEFINELHPTHR